MKRPNTYVVLTVVLALFFVPLPSAPLLHAQSKAAPPGGPVVERGKFHFYDFKKVIGEESYEIAQEGDNLVLRSRLELNTEAKASLAATLTLKPNYTPMKLEVKGNRPSGSKLDLSVEITARAATVREGSRVTEVMADLIIVAANPLESISNIRKIESVVVRGRIFDCARLWQVAGFQP